MGAGESTASTADENGKADGETEGNHNERLLGQLGTLDLVSLVPLSLAATRIVIHHQLLIIPTLYSLILTVGRSSTMQNTGEYDK